MSLYIVNVALLLSYITSYSCGVSEAPYESETDDVEYWGGCDYCITSGFMD